MKLAVISDVHGNYPALKAVLADAKAQGAEGYLFLGDYCMYIHYPNECVDAMRALPNSFWIAGNQEGYLQGLTTDGKTDGQMQMLYWTADALRPENRAWLCTLPQTADLELEGAELHLAHSSEVFIGDAEHRGFCSEAFYLRYQNSPPTSRELLQDIEEALGTDADFLDSLECMAEGVYLFGHNHIQWHGSFDGRLFVNPGSCGMPLDMQQGAPYTLLHLKQGRASAEERRAAYDVSAAVKALLASDMHRQTPIWAQIMGAQLENAREYAGFFLRFAADYAKKIKAPPGPLSKETFAAAFEAWKKENPAYFPVEQ